MTEPCEPLVCPKLRADLIVSRQQDSDAGALAVKHQQTLLCLLVVLQQPVKKAIAGAHLFVQGLGGMNISNPK